MASIISEKHFSKTILQIKLRISLNVFHFKSDIILFSRKKFKELGIEFGYSPALINSVIEWVTRGARRRVLLCPCCRLKFSAKRRMLITLRYSYRDVNLTSSSPLPDSYVRPTYLRCPLQYINRARNYVQSNEF